MSQWVMHVKDFQNEHGCSYKEAMQHPDCKASYHSKKGGALGFQKMGKKLDNFGDNVGHKMKNFGNKAGNELEHFGNKVGNELQDFGNDVNKRGKKTIDYLGDTENRHYGRNINRGIQKTNQYVQAAKPALNMIPIAGKYVAGLSQAQANLSNQIYKDSRKKNKSLDEAMGLSKGGNIDPFDSASNYDMIPNFRLRKGRGFLTNGEMYR